MIGLEVWDARLSVLVCYAGLLVTCVESSEGEERR